MDSFVEDRASSGRADDLRDLFPLLRCCCSSRHSRRIIWEYRCNGELARADRLANCGHALPCALTTVLDFCFTMLSGISICTAFFHLPILLLEVLLVEQLICNTHTDGPFATCVQI